MSHRLWLLAGFGVLAGLMFTGALLGQWGGPEVTRAVDDLGLVGFAVFAATCAGIAACRSHRLHRAAWISLTLGLICWAIGEAIWCYYELWQDQQQAPFPALSDVGFLLFPLGAGAALILLPVGHTASSRITLILDGVIVAGSMFLVLWMTVVKDIYNTAGIGTLARIVSMAYPILDIMLITVAVMVLARAQASQRVTMALMTCGIILMAFADSVWVYLTTRGTYYSAHPIDLGWMAGFVVIGCAAIASTWEPHRDPNPESRASLTHWLPYLPLAAACTVVASQLPHVLPPGPGPFVVLGLVTTVLLRQFIVVKQDRRRLITVTEQASRDPLTGLANRLIFLDRLTRAIASHHRQQQEIALVSIDLDKFKPVNDRLGHAAGDELLIRVAERLLGNVRSTDTVARFGGDEFLILLEGGNHRTLTAIAQRIIAAFEAPFIIEGHELRVRPSTGLAILETSDNETSAERLLKQADAAMYSAKRAGTGKLHTISPTLNHAPHRIRPYRHTSVAGADTAHLPAESAEIRRST